MASTQSSSVQQLLSPLLTEATPKSWLFPTSVSPLPPTAFSPGLPISIQQELICQKSALVSGTTVEQLIIPSHDAQNLLYGFVYATGAKYSETQRENRRSQSRSHALEARFCYDAKEGEFVMVQVGHGKRGAMSFRRIPGGAFQKCFFEVECDDGIAGRCFSARCVVGEIEEACNVQKDVCRNGCIHGRQSSDGMNPEDNVAESAFCISLCSKVKALESTVKGSFFSLSSTEHMLCGKTVRKRDIGRELTIVGNVDAVMITGLTKFAASTHYSETLSPRVEEKMDIAVRRRLAAWRSLQRQNLRNYGKKWELESLRGLRVALEKRYEVLKKEHELLRILVER